MCGFQCVSFILLLTISVDDKHERNEVYGIIIVTNIVSLCRYDSMEILKVRSFVLFLRLHDGRKKPLDLGKFCVDQIFVEALKKQNKMYLGI